MRSSEDSQVGGLRSSPIGEHTSIVPLEQFNPYETLRSDAFRALLGRDSQCRRRRGGSIGTPPAFDDNVTSASTRPSSLLVSLHLRLRLRFHLVSSILVGKSSTASARMSGLASPDRLGGLRSADLSTASAEDEPQSKIRRTTTACQSCRKVKTRCEVPPFGAMCRSCKNLGYVGTYAAFRGVYTDACVAAIR